MSEQFEVGDAVRVLDEDLAMLRRMGAPTNHHGRVFEIWDDGTLLIEFPIGRSYEHSQVAPYQDFEVRHLTTQ